MTATPVSLSRLLRIREIFALRMVENHAYAELFERMEAEIALAEAIAHPDPVERARRTMAARRTLDAFMNMKEFA